MTSVRSIEVMDTCRLGPRNKHRSTTNCSPSTRRAHGRLPPDLRRLDGAPCAVPLEQHGGECRRVRKRLGHHGVLSIQRRSHATHQRRAAANTCDHHPASIRANKGWAGCSSRAPGRREPARVSQSRVEWMNLGTSTTRTFECRFSVVVLPAATCQSTKSGSTITAARRCRRSKPCQKTSLAHVYRWELDRPLP
jgi:hypothetical protein